MSDRLTVSATLSVLMMSIYVLFGADVSRLTVGSEELTLPYAGKAPGSLGNPGRLINFQ